MLKSSTGLNKKGRAASAAQLFLELGVMCYFTMTFLTVPSL